jgi:glucose-1-phosphate cytidylyltransferase
MKVTILAGGYGTRLAEETVLRPKPMVEIGGKPILWHIMQIYASYGFTDFLIACGFKGEVIKSYFRQYCDWHSDWLINLADGSRTIVKSAAPQWQVGLIDTGLGTMTGGRLLRLRRWIGDSTFMVTYGDGVSNLDIRALVAFHAAHRKLATVTAVHPPARFGHLVLSGDSVREFAEKSQTSEGWINGGFFVFEPQVLDYIPDENTPLEGTPLAQLAREGQLMAFRHDGYWQPMDTIREKQVLEALWASGNAPWKVWANQDGDYGVLSRQDGAGDRSYGVQGQVARRVA